jgi:hypothetical protein
MANPTSNFGWQMPTPTDLVTDLPADFEVFGQAVDTSMADLKGGTSGQVLSKNSNTDMDFVWVTSDDANAIQNTIVDAKGDLIAASASDVPARLAVGANNTKLVADSAQSTGMKWVGFQGASMYKSSAQAITTSVWTAVTFDSEEFDTDAFHNTSTNTSRITIPTGMGGKYLFTGTMIWQQNSGNNRAVAIYKNGGTSKQLCLIDPNGDFNTEISYATIISAVPGDYFELFTYQDTAGNLNAIGGTNGTNFQTTFLGA